MRLYQTAGNTIGYQNRPERWSRWLRNLLLVLLFSSVSAVPALLAQPVTVPTLITPGFRSQDLYPYFLQGSSEASEAAWMAAVSGGLSVVSASWEAGADAEVDRLFDETVDDNPGMTESERTALRDALLTQKDAQQADWETLAGALIEQEQAFFIQSLAYARLPGLPSGADSVDTALLDDYLEQAFESTYSLTDWDSLVQAGAAAAASAFEAAAVPAIEDVAANLREEAESDGTISTALGGEIFESSILQGLDAAAFEILSVAIGQKVRTGLEAFLAEKLPHLTIPELEPAPFLQSQIDPFLAAAANSASVDEWSRVVEAGRDYAYFAWRSEVEWERDILISVTLSQSGLIESDAEVYYNYLMSVLGESVDAAGQAWLDQADATIASEKSAFESALDGGSAPELKLAAIPIADFENMFLAVLQAPSEAAWQGAVTAGRDALYDEWTVSSDQRIDAAIDAALAADPDMTAAEENTLRDNLTTERGAAGEAWQAAAETLIEAERRTFLLGLLSSQLAPQLPEDLAGFETEQLDPIIEDANNQTDSPSEWRELVEGEIQNLFDAWRPTVADAILQNAQATVDEAVAGGLIESDAARALALDLIQRSLQAEADDLYIDAALGYTSEVFIEKIDEIFGAIDVPPLDQNLLSFNATVLTTAFTEAQTSDSLLEWTGVVNARKQGELRNWYNTLLTHVNGLIDDTISSSGLSGEDATILRDYLEYQLGPEVQQARRDWEIAASSLVGTRRMEFLTSLEPEVAAVNESGAPVLEITPLVAPQFDEEPLLYVFDLIENISTVTGWEQLAEEGVLNLAEMWHTQVDAIIDTMVTDITAGVTSDTFETITFSGIAEGEGERINSVLAYKDYVRSYLADQKNLQFALWTYEAEQVVQIGRDAYLAGRSLSAIEAQQEATQISIWESTGGSREAETEADQELDPNREPGPYELEAEQAIADARRQLQLGELQWRSDWRDRRDTGLTRYNQALNVLESQRDQYMYTMEQADLAWQTNIAMMEQFEGNMRMGIANITAQLQQMIAMNALFHTDVECPEDRRDSCVLTPGSEQDGVEPIWRELNPAGQAFQERLDALEAALESGAPLSGVVIEIQTALQSMQVHAKQRSDYWAGHIEGDARLTEEFEWAQYVAPNSKGKYDGIPQHQAIMQRGPSYYESGVSTNITNTQIVYRKWIQDPAPPYSGYDGYGGYDDYYGGSSPGGHYETKVLGDLMDDPSTWDLTDPSGNPISVNTGELLRLRQLAYVQVAAEKGADAGSEWEDFLELASQEQRLIVDGTAGAGQVCGSEETVSADAAYGFGCSSALGSRAFVYYASSGQHGLYTGWAPVRMIDVDVPYTWHDVNAEANWKIWNEALAAMMAVSQHWEGEVLPDVQAWEQQVADYKAGYEEWQLEAAERIAEYESAYEAGKNRLLDGRSLFLYNMDEEWADGQAQYTGAYADLNEVEELWQLQMAALIENGEDADEALVAELQARLDEIVGSIEIDRTEVPEVQDELEEILSTLPELEEDFVTQFQNDLPEPERIAGLVNEFAEVAQGMLNFAMLHSVGDMMEQAREDYIEQIKKILEGIGDADQGELPEKPYTAYEVVVHDDGSISGVRTIYSGKAIEVSENRRGYSLKPEDYAPEMRTQDIFFSTPQANKLPELGDLFSTGLEAARNLIGEAFQQSGANGSSAYAFVEAQVGEQQEVAQTNVDNYFKDMQGRIARDQNEKAHDEAPGKIIKTVLAAASTLVGCVPCGAALVAWSAVDGFRDGGIVGALSGIVSGAVSSLAVGLNIDLSYSYEEGFGGSVGFGLGEGGSGFGLNVGFGSQEGIGLGWTGSAASGSGLSFGLNIDGDGVGFNAGFGDVSAGVNYNYEEGFGANVGYDFGGGYTAGLAWSEEGGLSGNLQRTSTAFTSEYLRGTGTFGLSLGGQGLGISNTFSYEAQAGGFHGWNGGASGGSYLGQSGSVTNTLNFGPNGVNLSSDTTARWSSEWLNSQSADLRDRWLAHTSYAKDEYGNRVKRLALEDRLLGELAENGQYALCPGSSGTEVCVLSGDGTYLSVGMTPEQLVSRLQEQYGADQFNLTHQGMATDFDATQDAAELMGEHKLGISIGVENTSGVNLLNVLSHLSGDDRDGQAQAYADLIAAIYTEAGPEAVHRVLGHSDGSSITASADYILNQNGFMDALSDNNTWLSGSPTSNGLFNFLAGNGTKHWTELSNVYNIDGDPVAGMGMNFGAHSFEGYWDLYASMDGADVLLNPLNPIGLEGALLDTPSPEELLAAASANIRPIESTYDPAEAIRTVLADPDNGLTQEQLWNLEDELARLEGREPPRRLDREYATLQERISDPNLSDEERSELSEELADLGQLIEIVEEIEQLRAELNGADSCDQSCMDAQARLDELESSAAYVEYTGQNVMAATNPDEYMQQLGQGLGPSMREFIEGIRDDPDSFAFDVDLAAERDAKEEEIADLQEQLKDATGDEAKRIQAQIEALNRRVAEIDTLEDRFDDVKEWLLSEDEDMTEEERLDFLAGNTVGSLCNVISYCIFGEVTGQHSMDFFEFYQDQLQKGQIGGESNAYYNMGSGALEDLWGMERRGSASSSIGQDAALQYLEGQNVAISWQDTNGSGSPNHFMLITRNQYGTWVNSDHTSYRESRRGGETDWSKVFGLRYLGGN